MIIKSRKIQADYYRDILVDVFGNFGKGIEMIYPYVMENLHGTIVWDPYEGTLCGCGKFWVSIGIMEKTILKAIDKASDEFYK